MLQWIKKFIFITILNRFVVVDSNRIKWIIKEFSRFDSYIEYEVNGVKCDIKPFIQDIIVKEYRDRTVVEIYSDRPGLIIGKGGKVLNSLGDFVATFNTDSKQFLISLKDSEFWDIDYNKLS
jgi:ribosomal protein S3